VNEDNRITDDEQLLQQLVINYVKSNFHRVIRVDGGAFGAVKDDENIHLELFSERRSIPSKIILVLDEDGDVQSTSAEPPSSPMQVDRELEVSLSMSIDTAASLVEQLLELLGLTEEDDDEDEANTDERESEI
jgi:hypothetical protein